MWQKQARQKVEAARVFQAQVKDAIRQFRNAIETPFWQQTWPGKGQRVEAGGVARNVAKAGAAKAESCRGGSCRGVFQALVKDAIQQFRMATGVARARQG